jgi:hypothetical protein
LSLYLDASVLLPTLVPEPGSAAVDLFFSTATEPLVVSEFAAAEVSSAISRLVRMRLIRPDQATGRLAAFDGWRATEAEMLDVESADMRLAGVIVRRFDLMLRAPDALHLAICQRLGAQLITLDARLATAAGELGIEVSRLG